MHKRKLVKVYEYGDVLRVMVSLSGPDPDGGILYRIDEDEEDEPEHTEPLFTLNKGLRHTNWPKSAMGSGVAGLLTRGRARNTWKVPKTVLQRARKTIIRSRLKQYAMWKVAEVWRGIDIFDWMHRSIGLATLVFLILLFFKEV